MSGGGAVCRSEIMATQRVSTLIERTTPIQRHCIECRRAIKRARSLGRTAIPGSVLRANYDPARLYTGWACLSGAFGAGLRLIVREDFAVLHVGQRFGDLVGVDRGNDGQLAREPGELPAAEERV